MSVTFAVLNKSETVSDADVQKALPVFQHQVNYHFAPFWHAGAKLHFFGEDAKPPKTMWRAEIHDDPTASLMGDHDDDAETDLPYFVIAAALDAQAGIEWTVTFSHELLESLADPWVNASAQVNDKEFYALEVCDPVQGEPQAYSIPDADGEDVWVSDFVLPAWFMPTSGGQTFRKYDYAGALSSPLEIAEYGYASVFISGTGWVQRQMQNGEPVDVPAEELGSASAPVGPGKFRPRQSQVLRRKRA